MKDIYLIRATLNDKFDRVKGFPYRTIAIGRNITLYYFAQAIVHSFDFNFDHCFGFYDNLEDYFESKNGFELFADIGEESEYPGVKNARVKEIFDSVGDKMLFLFDYGDEWTFELEFVEIAERMKHVKYPLVVDSFLKSPKQYGNH